MSPARVKIAVAGSALLVFFTALNGVVMACGDNNTYRTYSGVTTNIGRSAFVGHDGTNNTLEINFGATVTDGEACIGHAAPADRNTALVLGANSLWEHEGALTVGKNGSDNRLIVAGGARVVAEIGRIGENPCGDRNEVRVTGPGSEWVLDCSLSVGGKGSSSRLVIDNGGLVAAGAVSIGDHVQSRSNVVEVGGGSLLTVETGCGFPMCEVVRGTLRLLGGTVHAEGGVLVGAEGTLAGNGDIDADTACSGVYQPGAPIGALAHTGWLTLDDVSRAEFEIGGYEPETEFDISQVDTICTLAGTLRIVLANGFVPQAGDRFEIITAGEVLGDFSSVEVVNGPADLEANVIVSPTSVVVEFGARDGDGDRLPDPWEEKYFGAPCGADPDADDDHDGRCNYDEYVADTDPRDARSQFRIELEPLEEQTAVEFMSSTDRAYTLEYTADITDPAGITWTKVCKDVKGWGGLMQLIHANHDQRGFYRVSVGFTQGQ